MNVYLVAVSATQRRSTRRSVSDPRTVSGGFGFSVLCTSAAFFQLQQCSGLYCYSITKILPHYNQVLASLRASQMAAVMHASANNYSTRHSTGEYALRTSSTSTNSYFPWPEAHSSLTSPSATMSTHSHRSMMQHGDTTQGTHSTASTSTYNPNWSSIYTPTSSESAHCKCSSAKLFHGVC